jgi:hypothetical protein
VTTNKTPLHSAFCVSMEPEVSLNRGSIEP